jgi:hypothetical protein
MIAYSTATTQDEYKEAATEFGCAVDARPTFALANYYLSQASIDEASPQNGEAFFNLLPESDLEQIVSHEKIVLNGLVRDGLTVDAYEHGDYGFLTYFLGLMQKKLKLIKFGLEETQKAIFLDTSQELPFLRFNEGVMLLASGKKDQAQAAFANSLNTPADKLSDDLAVANITGLLVFLHYCPGIQDASYCKSAEDLTNRFKQQSVAAAWPVPAGSVSKDRGAGVSGPQLTNVGLVAARTGSAGMGDWKICGTQTFWRSSGTNTRRDGICGDPFRNFPEK